MFEKGEQILLAVSGGVDSIVMAELFRSAEIPLAIAHCNFGLRGTESDLDEAFVTAWAKKYAIRFHVKKVEIKGKSIQIEARDKRYEWFRQLVKENGYSRIATAHHLDDSLETTLLNLARGTGIRGLRGIPTRSEGIIRPLLFATKKQILGFAKDMMLDWREDLSNHKTDYARNKVRLEVTPKLQELNPKLMETYQDTKERMDLATAFIEKRSQEVMKTHFDSKTGELALSWMEDQSDLVLLSEILSHYGFNYPTVKEIFETKGNSGKRFPTEQYEVLMDRTSLFIIERSVVKASNELIIEGEGTYQVGETKLTVERRPGLPKMLDQGTGVALLNADKVYFPIIIRPWRQGDTFIPLGMKGRKKVSDFLINEKVPLAIKKYIRVLEISDEIAWVVGYRVSEVFKVSDRSATIWRIKTED